MNWRWVAVVGAVCVCLMLTGASMAQNDWAATVDTEQWATGSNWTLMHQPQEDETVTHVSSSGPNIIKGVGSGQPLLRSFLAQVPDQQNRSLTLAALSGSGNVLLTKESVFRTGDGTGTYSLVFEDNTQAVVGTLGDGFIGDLYGLRLSIEGTFDLISTPGAQVERTMGWGPVELLGPFQAFIQVTGDVNATPPLLGRIDCAYNGTGSPVDPTVHSQWRIGNGIDLHTFHITANELLNVGDWRFASPLPGSDSVSILANQLQMYSVGGKLDIEDVELELIQFFGYPASAPSALFGGSSELRYAVAGFNDIFIGAIDQDSVFRFGDATGKTAHMKPRSYPTVAPSGGTYSLNIRMTDGLVDVQTRVAREGKAFDASFAQLAMKPSLTVESFAVDVGNIAFIDQLLLDDLNPHTAPVSCFPFVNRTAKHWFRWFLEAPVAVTRRDAEDNQAADYLPDDERLEAYYMCRLKVPDGGGASVDGENLRIYARFEVDTAETFPAIPLGLTRYMDADLDFDVDVHDFARFQNSFTGANTQAAPNAHATWYPLADWGTTPTNQEADADVDLLDYQVLHDRWHDEEVPDQPVPPEPPDEPDWRVCTGLTLPVGNLVNPNGHPETVVCGGPLHVRPEGPGVCSLEACAEGSCADSHLCPPPALDTPNCTVHPLGCGPTATCAVPCPWDDGVRNPDGIFQIRVVESTSGASCINVSANTTVNYQIIGVLCDTNNDGLALWATDLDLVEPAGANQIPLSAASPGPAMGNFVSPQGINNPGGYGGTPILTTVTYPDEFLPGSLVQIGGAQNTIKNVVGNAPFPIGPVTANVGFTEVALATGSVTMPTTAGMYTLRLSNVLANVIVDGQIAADGEYFRTERADVGSVENLRIFVGTTSSIVSANPPLDNPYIVGTQPYRDVLDTGNGAPLTEGIGGAGTMSQGTPPNQVQYAPILVTFSATPVPAPSTGNIEVRCSYIDTTGPDTTTCPGVSSVSGSGAGPYQITLTSPIPPGGCTSIMFAHTCAMLQYESLPGDVNMGGITNTQDLLAMVQALNNGTAAANPARYNLNRDAIANTQDLLRLTQLLNGTLTTQPWNQVALAACDGAPPCFVQQEPEGGGEGEGESGSSSLLAAGGGAAAMASGGAGVPESSGELIAAIQAACTEWGWSAEDCQPLLDYLANQE